MTNTSAQIDAVRTIKDSMGKIHFENQTFSSPIAYAFMYVQWEANEVSKRWKGSVFIKLSASNAIQTEAF